jgi:Fe-S cluster assembly protein SufB
MDDNWRLESFRIWQKMEEPDWANIKYEKPDFQAIKYYAAPKKTRIGKFRRSRSRIIENFCKIRNQYRRAKTFSWSCGRYCNGFGFSENHFQETLKEKGIIFCSISEAIKNHPDLVQKYIGKVVPRGDNFYAALNSAVFSDGSFCYIPKGVKCPMELSTYFRINQAGTGQFERTLVIADEGSYVSYLEGCTAPARDENQLHAAVVELIAWTMQKLNILPYKTGFRR